jgi:membrane protein implicated in regulation of membrane protease activity
VGGRSVARIVLAAAALIVLGAGLAAPWPQEYRGSLLAGASVVLAYLAHTADRNRPDRF